jgi:hypothetical protein
MISYKYVTMSRALFGGILIGALLGGQAILAYVAMVLFLLAHWFASISGLKHKVNKQDYRFSSIVSSGVLFIVLGIILFRETIPILLAAIFISASIIKLVFLMQTHSVPHDYFKPFSTNWSLTASLFFLACYFRPPSESAILLSGAFLAYLLVSIGVFTKQVMKKIRKDRELAVQRR